MATGLEALKLNKTQNYYIIHAWEVAEKIFLCYYFKRNLLGLQFS